ncbi:MAG: carbohydrate ABC transporter permease [Oscillospiraceae bacterium]|nr:carbohydrate ABC transporter permease [Oscillospiraceae bacterium]
MKKKIRIFTVYLILILIAMIMLYPVLWMISATFKSNSDIFSDISLIPHKITLSGYKAVLRDYGGDINILKAMLNTFRYVVPKVIFTVISSLLTAYGLVRYNFKGRKIIIALLLSSLFLPETVLNIPKFVMFNNFGWVDSPSYLPMVVPSAFADETCFVFMMMQFMRGVPGELDEAAQLDGCSPLRILFSIILPAMKPCVVTCAVFQFIWSSNDYLSPLLYVNTPSRYPSSVFIKMFQDIENGFDWNQVMVISLVSVLPSIAIYAFTQKYFTDNITVIG